MEVRPSTRLRRDGRRSAGEKLEGPEVGEGGGRTDRQAERKGEGGREGEREADSGHAGNPHLSYTRTARRRRSSTWRARRTDEGGETVHFVNLPARAAAVGGRHSKRRDYRRPPPPLSPPSLPIFAVVVRESERYREIITQDRREGRGLLREISYFPTILPESRFMDC